MAIERQPATPVDGLIEQDPEGIAKVETALEEQITEQVTPTRASGIPWS